MRKVVAVAVAVAFLGSGCVPPRSARTPLIVAGVVTSAVGVGVGLTAAAGDDDPDGGDVVSDQAMCSIGACMLSLALVAVGIGMILGGVAASEPDPAPDRPPPLVTDAGGTPAPAAADPLPAMDAAPETLRYATSARSAARHGKCAATRALLARIADRDPEYHDALVTNPTIAACR